ncbi:unnamed protein product, partial [Dicrocoelium dendriticum]
CSLSHNLDTEEHRKPDRRNITSFAMRLCEFEVYGKVQGVFFRKYAREYAKKVGLVGWVKNTEQGTVCGVFEGPDEAVSLFKQWLANTGSPKSKIDRCEIKSERSISHTTFSDFQIRR